MTNMGKEIERERDRDGSVGIKYCGGGENWNSGRIGKNWDQDRNWEFHWGGGVRFLYPHFYPVWVWYLHLNPATAGRTIIRQ